MFKKDLLVKYIDDWRARTKTPQSSLAALIGMSPSNLKRACESESHNFTLEQFSAIVKIVELTPDQVFHILTGSRKTEALDQLLIQHANAINESFKDSKNKK